MADILSWYQPTRALRSSDSLLLTAPQSRPRNFGDRALKLSMHPIYSEMDFLYICLRSANTLDCLKIAEDFSRQWCIQPTDTMASILAWTLFLLYLLFDFDFLLIYHNFIQFAEYAYWCVSLHYQTGEI